MVGIINIITLRLYSFNVIMITVKHIRLTMLAKIKIIPPAFLLIKQIIEPMNEIPKDIILINGNNVAIELMCPVKVPTMIKIA